MKLQLIPKVLVQPGTKIGKSSNLAFALRSLPAETRRDMLIFYQFCRVVDDIADDPHSSPEEKETALSQWSEAVNGEKSLPSDLKEVIDRHTVPPDLLEAIVDGVRTDIHPKPFPDFQALKEYCWKVAVAVGLVSNRITGCKSPRSEMYAENLGLALQLTNILRDVAEDAAMGRVYLPVEELQLFDVSVEDLKSQRSSDRTEALFQMQAERCLDFFVKLGKGPPAGDAKALVAAEAMRRIYFCLLRKMMRDRCRVLEIRYRLSTMEKIFCLLPAAFCR